MRVLPRSPWRPLVIIALGAGAIGFRLYQVHIPTRVHDSIDAIPDEFEQLHNLRLDALADGYGVEIHYVIDSLPDDTSIESATLERARSLKVGRRTEGQGILVFIDYGSGKMRIEVSPQLQDVFTDAFVGYLLRSHLLHFAERHNIELGLRMMLTLMAFRIQQAVLDERWDPSLLERTDTDTRLAAGGGASLKAMEPDPTPWLKSRHSPEAKATLGPQPTPEEAFATYLRWLRLDPIDARVDLFLPKSQAALDANPYTRPFMDLEVIKYDGRPFHIVERGDLAMVYVTNTPLVWPMLFRRSPAGWQVDVLAEWSHIAHYGPGTYIWAWRYLDDEWDLAFHDQFMRLDRMRYVRLRQGDNRPLAYGHHKWE